MLFFPRLLCRTVRWRRIDASHSPQVSRSLIDAVFPLQLRLCLDMGFQSLGISCESAIHRQLKDSVRCAMIVLRRLLSPSRISYFKSNLTEQRQNRTYLINPSYSSFPSRLTIFRRVVRRRPCNPLDYDLYRIGLWLPANLDIVFAGADEDNIHV